MKLNELRSKAGEKLEEGKRAKDELENSRRSLEQASLSREEKYDFMADAMEVDEDFLRTPLHDTGSVWLAVLSFILPLLGLVPEHADVILAAAWGVPLCNAQGCPAARACANIARRLEGESIPLMLR